MESLRSGEAFSWPSWTPEQVLDDHHRKMSEEQMTRWREEGQQKPPAPPADEPRARVPLIDPYAPATCYPVPPPEPPRLPVEPPRPQVSAPPPAPRRESFPQAKPAVSSVKAMPQPKVAVSAKPAKAEPAGESWSSKQQRLKKEQREARLAENLRRRAARGGDEEVKNGRPSHEDAVLHSAENSQDPQSSSFPVKEEPPNQTSKAGGGVDAEPKEAEIDLQGVPLRVLRSKQPSGSGLLSWGKPKIGQ
ncbi:unnamed protein product [Cladocopium goreaui]|uniref:J domain-containing protein n=1 Tax=Cladocopium goreaui TaxID=2562237 RepID=A0A9P1CZ53_9DINO|nr:unnamed protein product [Cladocopium goreaui]